jgi:hypothetical protein
MLQQTQAGSTTLPIYRPSLDRPRFLVSSRVVGPNLSGDQGSKQ